MTDARKKTNVFGRVALRAPTSAAVTLVSILATASPLHADHSAAGAAVASANGPGGAPQTGQGAKGGASAQSGGDGAGGAGTTAAGGGGGGGRGGAGGKEKPDETPFYPPNNPASMVLLYCLLLAAFTFGLRVWDIQMSYRFAKETRDGLFAKVPPDQLIALVGSASLTPAGIPGFSRSLLAFTLLFILGIAVFHLVMFGGPGFSVGDNGKLVHDLLMLLAGAVTSITGFYFGGKAVQEGAFSAAAQPRAAKATPGWASITNVFPKQGPAGTAVTIVGSAFGTSPGQVKIDATDAAIKSWSDTTIEITVPAGLTPGLTTLTVNPPAGVAVTGNFTAV